MMASRHNRPIGRKTHLSSADRRWSAVAAHGTASTAPTGEALTGDLRLAVAAASCENDIADRYACRNVDLPSFLPLADLGGRHGNDVWDQTDSETGREYALMGPKARNNRRGREESGWHLVAGNGSSGIQVGSRALTVWMDTRLLQFPSLLIIGAFGATQRPLRRSVCWT